MTSSLWSLHSITAECWCPLIKTESEAHPYKECVQRYTLQHMYYSISIIINKRRWIQMDWNRQSTGSNTVYCIEKMKPFVKPKTDSKRLTTKEQLHKTKKTIKIKHKKNAQNNNKTDSKRLTIKEVTQNKKQTKKTIKIKHKKMHKTTTQTIKKTKDFKTVLKEHSTFFGNRLILHLP